METGVKSKWIDYKGKRIFYVDFSNFGSDSHALRQEAHAIIAEVVKEPPDSVLALSNAAGTVGTPENMVIFKGIVTRTGRFVRKRAVVGVTGVRQVLLETLNRVTMGKPMMAFEEEEAAKKWLVE
jgi:hypothetical protein